MAPAGLGRPMLEQIRSPSQGGRPLAAIMTIRVVEHKIVPGLPQQCWNSLVAHTSAKFIAKKGE